MKKVLIIDENTDAADSRADSLNGKGFDAVLVVPDWSTKSIDIMPTIRKAQPEAKIVVYSASKMLEKYEKNIAEIGAYPLPFFKESNKIAIALE